MTETRQEPIQELETEIKQSRQENPTASRLWAGLLPTASFMKCRRIAGVLQKYNVNLNTSLMTRSSSAQVLQRKCDGENREFCQ